MREVLRRFKGCVEVDGIGEGDVELSVITDEEFCSTNESGDTFFLFFAAFLFIFIADIFDDFFVSDRAGYNFDGHVWVCLNGLGEHAEDAEFRLKDLSSAGAAAFDEELDGVTFIKYFCDIVFEASGIELFTAERAFYEEGAATTENAADDGEIEVFAGGDVWGEDAVLEEDDAEDEVIDMTFMAWDEDDSIFFGEFTNFIDFFGIEVEAVIDEREHGNEYRAEDFDHDEGELRGCFIENVFSVFEEVFLRQTGGLTDGEQFGAESVAVENFAQELLMGFNFRPIHLLVHVVDIVNE